MHALASGTDLIGIRGPSVAAITLGPVLWLGFARLLLRRTGRAATPKLCRNPLRRDVAEVEGVIANNP